MAVVAAGKYYKNGLAGAGLQIIVRRYLIASVALYFADNSGMETFVGKNLQCRKYAHLQCCLHSIYNTDSHSCVCPSTILQLHCHPKWQVDPDFHELLHECQLALGAFDCN